jgi:NADPH:quinone reductase-like Zn-dependent oxidoreductase
MAKRLRIAGTMLRSRSFEEKAEATSAFERDVMPFLAHGTLRVPIDKVFNLEEAAAAHRYIEENQNFGKVVFSI